LLPPILARCQPTSIIESVAPGVACTKSQSDPGGGLRPRATPAREIRLRGYTGSISNLQRLLGQWRRADESKRSPSPVADRQVEASPTIALPPAIDPATGWSMTPIVAAALCIKPRGALSKNQAAKVDVLKSGWPDFTIMRQLAMGFRSLLQNSDLERFATWLDDAQRSGIYGMQRFARMVRRDSTLSATR
jgi:hypothetical protein